MYIVLCFTFLIIAADAEVITLLKNNTITCIKTGSAVNEAIVISPPTHSVFVKESQKIDSWIFDDWKSTNSTSSNQQLVLDERWEDFDMCDETMGYMLPNNSISISICHSGSMTITVLDESFLNETSENFVEKHVTDQHTSSSKACQWYHYAVVKTNNNIRLISEYGESLAEYTLSFNPFWIYFINSKSDHTFWKLHDYKFRSSDTVTTGQESAVAISVSENQCLSMYVSVDENCFLDITLELNGENITKTVIGFNENDFKKWQKIEIQSKSAGNGKLSFFRGSTQTDVTTGYWAVDEITLCNGDTKVNQMTVDESVKEYRCKPLKKSSPKNTDNILLCDNPGYLGKNCNVSCSGVLGKSTSYCENYKICQEGANCYCSWGYEGSFCEKPCPEGTWGLFCKSRCKSECSDCHQSTGECPNSTSHDEIASETPTKSAIDNVLTEENLPESVILDSNKILIEIPENRKINNSIIYHVKYSCVSPWCANQVVKEDNKTIIPPYNKQIMSSEFKQMNPFTTYQPEVTVKMLNQSINKKYDEIKPKLGYFHVANLSVYSHNGTTLWIRFEQPDATASPSQFRIWYLPIAYASKSPPNCQSTLTKCPLWDDYICGRIDNLEPDSLYSIILEAKETDDQKWALSEPIPGFTNEEAPEAPENLDMKWVSNHEAILTWEHPFVTNGPLKEFEVEVEAGGVIASYAVPVENPQKTYQWTIPVNYSTMYSIKVWASNRFVGRSSNFSAFVFPPNPELSSLAAVETCFTSCYLLIPKPKNLGYYSTYDILVLHTNETGENIPAKVKKIKSDSETDINGRLVTELEDHNEKFFRIRIGDVPENEDSILEENYYLILSDNRDQYVVYPITQDKSVDNSVGNSVEFGGLLTTRNVIMFSTLSSFLLLVIISLLLLLLYRKRLHRRSLRTKTKPNNSDRTKDVALLLPGYENFTRIEKHRFAHFLANVLQCPKHFKDEFHSLPVSTKSIVHGFVYNNISKNRNQDYLPCKINNI